MDLYVSVFLLQHVCSPMVAETDLAPMSPVFIMTILFLAWQRWTTAPNAK